MLVTSPSSEMMKIVQVALSKLLKCSQSTYSEVTTP